MKGAPSDNQGNMPTGVPASKADKSKGVVSPVRKLDPNASSATESDQASSIADVAQGDSASPSNSGQTKADAAKTDAALSNGASASKPDEGSVSSLASKASSRPSVDPSKVAVGKVEEKTPEDPSRETLERKKKGIKRARARRRKHDRKRNFKRARNTVIVVAILIVALLAGSFGFFRWGAFDDAANIQGKWKIEGGKSKIEITEDRIKLNKEVSYSYKIDPFAKTITFEFGQLEGKGRYRFSFNNDQLCIEDGDFDWVQTLFADIPWTVEALWDQLASGGDLSPSLGGNSMTMKRVS